MLRVVSINLSLMTLLMSSAAHAALPEPVKEMINAAIASGDEDDIKTIVKIAKSTNPDDSAEIDALLVPYEEEKAQLAAAAKQEKLEAGFFENWSGEGELGAFRSTGNTSNTGLTAGIKLKKEGVNWRYKFRALADYQRNNGVTTKEQFVVALEPNYKISERLYAYGLTQYERDRFQGFSARYTLSGGLGYTVIDEEDVTLDVKAGPAWRRTQFVGGGSDSSIAALAGLDFGWQIAENLRFTEVADATFASGTNTFTSTTALDAKLSGALTGRLSYSVEHETNPPAGSVRTDTLSRVTIVYGF